MVGVVLTTQALSVVGLVGRRSAIVSRRSGAQAHYGAVTPRVDGEHGRARAIGSRSSDLRAIARHGAARIPSGPMRDLTSRALDTATALGASYADVRVVRRVEESINIKSGPRRGRAVGRDRGLRRPRARRRGVGLRREPPPVHRRGGPGRRRGRPDRQGQRDRPARPRPCSTTGPPAHGRFETPVDGGPVRGPARSQDRRPAGRRRGDERGQRHRLHRDASTRPSASGRRSPRATAATPSRSSPTSAPASRPTRSTATSTSAAATPTTAALWASAGYEFVRGMDLAGNAERDRERGRRAPAARRRCPRARARSCSTRASCTCRSTRAAATRPSSTAPSAPRPATPARASSRRTCWASFRYGSRPVRHRRRRDRRRRPRHVRLGRRGRRRPAGADLDQGGHVRRLPELARDGAADRPPSRAARCAPTAGTASRSSG